MTYLNLLYWSQTKDLSRKFDDLPQSHVLVSSQRFVSQVWWLTSISCSGLKPKICLSSLMIYLYLMCWSQAKDLSHKFDDVSQSPVVVSNQRWSHKFDDLSQSPVVVSNQNWSHKFDDVSQSPVVVSNQRWSHKFDDLPQSPKVVSNQRWSHKFDDLPQSNVQSQAWIVSQSWWPILYLHLMFQISTHKMTISENNVPRELWALFPSIKPWKNTAKIDSELYSVQNPFEL